MNKKVIALALASLVSMGGISTIYTAETKAIEAVETNQDNGAMKGTSIDKKIVEKVLKEKFKVSEKELKNAKSKDGGMKELMEKKKISMDKLMDEVKNEMMKIIDKDAKDGKISKEEATKMKEQLQGKMSGKTPSENKTPETTTEPAEGMQSQQQQQQSTPSQPQQEQ
ncbi:hypothetical protein [Clostridium cellulovorans]|uniref:EF-hand domain-containing protein n=1 Tax=Clostridium cellulovorans (strain ATCC 35296 / DSM 3052 / OCM 3 / 743B) TaxID=573061 RepID=D9SPD5_CLOC7|nr:hypothetical protein [Clostridium cellulovorans]ADL54037.1 hypothetical protein Clocel_4381 [Clostridium cellulovorans 743B]